MKQIFLLSAFIPICLALHGDVYLINNRIIAYDDFHDQQLNSFISNSTILKEEKVEKLTNILINIVQGLDSNRIREFEYEKIVHFTLWLRKAMQKNGEFSRSLFSTSVDTVLSDKPDVTASMKQETMYIARFMLPRRELKRMTKIENEAKSKVAAESLKLEKQALLSTMINFS